MTPDDWEQVERTWKNWREADLHDLRLRFASVMLAIKMHEREVRHDEDLVVNAADEQLWDIPRQEGF